jgi:hypothetical protein
LGWSNGIEGFKCSLFGAEKAGSTNVGADSELGQHYRQLVRQASRP